MSDQEYPPAHHVLSDLPFEIEVRSATEQRAHLDAAGRWSIGALATVVDVVCGSLCAGVIAPDWMATSSLTLRRAAIPEHRALVVDAATLRVGSRSVTIEVEVRAGVAGALVGDAVLVFARLERRSTNLDLSGRADAVGSRFRFGPAGGVDIVAWDDAIAQRVVDAATGRTETAITPYVRNSFGAVNGGVVAGIAATAGALSVGRAADAVDEVTVHHLSQGRRGPVHTSTRPLLDGAGRRMVRVELRDAGATDEPAGRLMAVAQVGVGLDDGRV